VKNKMIASTEPWGSLRWFVGHKGHMNVTEYTVKEHFLRFLTSIRPYRNSRVQDHIVWLYHPGDYTRVSWLELRIVNFEDLSRLFFWSRSGVSRSAKFRPWYPTTHFINTDTNRHLLPANQFPHREPILLFQDFVDLRNVRRSEVCF